MAPIDPASIIERSINENRIFIFSKTTCPFCTKVKKLFKDINEPYEVMELDQAPHGDEVKSALAERVGKTSVPQVFVKGILIGGCDDTHAAFESGKLRDLLVEHSYDFDFVVIGGGSGGLAASKAATAFGKKVALFDFVTPTPKGTTWGLGGTCVNVGCIPKKLMHQAALLGESMTDAHSFGWRPNVPGLEEPMAPSDSDQPPQEVSIKSVAAHNWVKLVDKVQNHIKMANFNYRVNLRNKKVKYINAFAELTDPHTIKATDKKGVETIYTSDKILIATGERPRYPSDCPGAREYGITSDDLFSLPYSPGKTVVIGASYVALECAGFLRGLGYDVTVIVRSILLRGFDQDIAEKIGSNMAEDGVKFLRPCIPTNIEQLEAATETSAGKLIVTGKMLNDDSLVTIECNTVMFAIGRDPCTDKIGLKQVGVNVDSKTGKIPVNALEETNIPNIYAVGDILQNRLELTPVAIEAGKLLVARIFGGQNRLCDYAYAPTTVFTPIEYGCVGYSEEKAIEVFGKENVDVYHSALRPYEWALTPRSVNACWAKLVVLLSENERVVGFHFLGPNAGEVTQFAALSLKLGAKKEDFDHLIGIHPTSAESFNSLTITRSSGQDPTQMKSCCG